MTQPRQDGPRYRQQETDQQHAQNVAANDQTNDQPVPSGFDATISADVQGAVEHHAPCVPECPVCHPEKSAE